MRRSDCKGPLGRQPAHQISARALVLMNCHSQQKGSKGTSLPAKMNRSRLKFSPRGSVVLWNLLVPSFCTLYRRIAGGYRGIGACMTRRDALSLSCSEAECSFLSALPCASLSPFFLRHSIGPMPTRLLRP